MHVLLVIIGALGAGLFWWYRIRAASDAAGEVVDAAQRARGAIVRRNFRNKAAESPFSAIDDPIIGAATIIISMAAEQGAFDARAEKCLREELVRVARSGDIVEEAVIYGKWASEQAVDASTPMRLISPMLNDMLTPEEREELIAIAGRVLTAAEGNRTLGTQLIKALRIRLGFSALQ